MSLLLAVAIATSAQFRVDRLAGGVYAAVATKPPGLMVQSNTLFVVGDDDVIVVDANLTASATKEVVAAIRKITRKPVRYVVNTHGHDDHVLGNAVYRDAYPGVEFIADPDTRTDIAGVIAASRKGMLENGPGFVAQIKEALAKGQNLRGEPLTDAERSGLASDVALAERYFDETPRTPIVLPATTFDGTMTLHRGTRTVEIRHVGRGHTRGAWSSGFRKNGSSPRGISSSLRSRWSAPTSLTSRTGSRLSRSSGRSAPRSSCRATASP